MDPATDAQGLTTRLMGWAAKPITTDMSLVDVALTTVFIATVIFLYWQLLSYIKESGINPGGVL